MKVQGKTFLVTGAGAGIGRALTQELVRRGASVVGVDLKKEALEETQKSLDGDSVKFKAYELDITNRAKVAELAQKIDKEKVNIDGLINNAGIIQPFVKVNDLAYEAIEKVMQVNFYGTLNMIKTFLPHLSKRPEAHIANISSMGGFLPVPGQSVYGASKAAVKLLSEGLYAELKNSSVRVSVVFPGATKTNIAQNSGIKIAQESQEKNKFPTLTPEKAAKIIIDGIEKNKFQIFTGKDSNFMNLLYRLNPKFATDFIAKQMKSLLGE